MQLLHGRSRTAYGVSRGMGAPDPGRPGVEVMPLFHDANEDVRLERWAMSGCAHRRMPPTLKGTADRAPGAPGTLRGLKQKLFGPPFITTVSTRPRGPPAPAPRRRGPRRADPPRVPAGAELGAGAELPGRPQPPGRRKKSCSAPPSSRAPQIQPRNPPPESRSRLPPQGPPKADHAGLSDISGWSVFIPCRAGAARRADLQQHEPQHK